MPVTRADLDILVPPFNTLLGRGGEPFTISIAAPGLSGPTAPTGNAARMVDLLNAYLPALGTDRAQARYRATLTLTTVQPVAGTSVTFTIDSAPSGATLTVDPGETVPATPTVTHTYATAGTRTVTLKDSRGTVFGTVAVNVASAPVVTPPAPTPAPTLSASTTTPTAGNQVTFTLGNIPTGATLLLETGHVVAAAGTVAYTFATAGTRTVVFKDSAGNVLDTEVIVVSDPVTLSISPPTAPFGTTLMATLGGTVIGDVVDWGDGSPTVAATGSPTHAYASSGPYTVRVLGANGTVKVGFPIVVSTPVVGITWQEPITITDATPNKVISGAYQRVDDPTKSAVKIDTLQPVVVENFDMRTKGIGITSRHGGANVTVRNGTIRGLNPDVAGRSQDRAVDLQFAKSFLVEHLTLEGTTGIYINGHTGMTASDSKVIRYILGIDIMGQKSDGNGGYMPGDADFFRGQLVQLNNINGQDVLVDWWRCDNTPRQSHVEDVVSVIGGKGKDAAHPVRIANGLVNGAFAFRPDGSYSGGGVMFEQVGQYVESDGIIVVQASNYGLAIAGGRNIRHKNFLVIGSGRLADGTLLDKDTDTGIYARPYKTIEPATLEFRDGVVGWGAPSATNAAARQDFGVGANAQLINVTKEPAGPITEGRMQAARDLFAQRVAAAGVTLGRVA